MAFNSAIMISIGHSAVYYNIKYVEYSTLHTYINLKSIRNDNLLPLRYNLYFNSGWAIDCTAGTTPKQCIVAFGTITRDIPPR